MKRKSSIMLSALGLSALALAGVGALAGSKVGFVPASGQEVEWGIDFTAEDNALQEGEKQIALSKLGNSFEFQSKGLSKVEGKYAKFAKGASLANSTIIHQLKSVEVTFSEGAALTVSWGWEADNLIRENALESGVAYSFDGDAPDYFALQAQGDVEVESISLRFTCSGESLNTASSYEGLLAGKGYYQAVSGGKTYSLRLNGGKAADLYADGVSLGEAYLEKTEEGYALVGEAVNLTIPATLDGKAVLVKGTLNGVSLTEAGLSFARALDLDALTHVDGYKFSAVYQNNDYAMAYVAGEGYYGLQGKVASKCSGSFVKDGVTYPLHYLDSSWKYKESEGIEGVSEDLAKRNLKTMMALDSWKFVSLTEDKLTFQAEGQLNKGDGFVATLGASCAVTNTSWSYLRATLVVSPETGEILSATMGGKYSSSSYYQYSDSDTYSFSALEKLDIAPSAGSGITAGGEAGGGLEEEFGD